MRSRPPGHPPFDVYTTFNRNLYDMQVEPLVQWSEPVTQFVSFAGQFFAAGAIGFRYFALRGREIESDPFYVDAERRAAVIGLIGIVITLALAAYQLPGLAARRHSTAVAFLTSDPSTMLEFGLFGLALIGFLLAALRVPAWPLAAIGVVVGSLRAALLGKWVSLVNPVHVLAAGLWIGTLFVLVVAGLSALLAHEPTRARRGAIAADMVNGFSPWALTMGVVVVVFGVITAWRHLHVLSNLWSTPYGMTLIGKLCFVGCVFVLGAWNWRRQRPTLGTEPAAAAIRRSGTVELMFALVVLLVTAILVSLPSPKA
jgi:putative copper export protein